MTGKISLFPQGIHFQNYVRVLTLKELPPALFVSIARTVLGTIFTVFAASFPAYAFTRNEYWGRKFFYRFVVVTMYFSGGLIPTYLVVNKLHLIDTIWAMVIPNAVSVFNIIITRTYFINSIPDELLEAAQLDGANTAQYLMKVVLPLSKPILAVITLFLCCGTLE